MQPDTEARMRAMRQRAAQAESEQFARKQRERAKALLPPAPMTRLQIAGIVAYHLVPLIVTLWSHGSPALFLLLCLANIVYGIVGSFVANSVVTLRQAPPRESTLWSRIEPWVSLLVVAVFFGAVLAILFGWIVIAMLPDAFLALADRQLWIGLALMVVASLPGHVTRGLADLRAGVPETTRFARDRPAALLQIVSGLALLILSVYAFDWFGSAGFYPLMFALTAFFVLRDLRSQWLLRQFFPGLF